jgi:uncharacterized membrane protein
MQPIMATAEAARVPAGIAVPVAARLRLDAVDFVRGLVMILMVLDHTRDFAHRGGMFADPLDPATTTPILYLTRWITHLCAPTFVLLAGLGVGLRRIRGATSADNAWFLFTRGLWLIAMELVVMRVLIWAIGVSMVLLSAIVRLPLAAIGTNGAVIVLGHNLLDGIRVPFWFPGTPEPPPTLGGILWMLVHQSGFYPLGGPHGPVVFDRYPVLPWFGLLCVGYVLAEAYRWESARRVRFLATSAVVMLGAFLVLRTFNIYGNPSHWAPQPTAMQSAMAFMNVEKYPPSLAYVLVTLLPALTLLAALDGRTIAGGLRGAVVTFGRVPFFFYILQWITAHLSGMIVTALLGQSLWPFFQHLLTLVTTQPQPDFGGPLWAVYVCWLVSLLAMYPLCRWFAAIKAQRRDWWLSYL